MLKMTNEVRGHHAVIRVLLTLDLPSIQYNQRRIFYVSLQVGCEESSKLLWWCKLNTIGTKHATTIFMAYYAYIIMEVIIYTPGHVGNKYQDKGDSDKPHIEKIFHAFLFPVSTTLILVVYILKMHLLHALYFIWNINRICIFIMTLGCSQFLLIFLHVDIFFALTRGVSL